MSVATSACGGLPYKFLADYALESGSRGHAPALIRPAALQTAPTVTSAPALLTHHIWPCIEHIRLRRSHPLPGDLVNDPYPGRCRAYRDTNKGDYYDLSEAEG